jgi:hypothetical protein
LLHACNACCCYYCCCCCPPMPIGMHGHRSLAGIPITITYTITYSICKTRGQHTNTGATGHLILSGPRGCLPPFHCLFQDHATLPPQQIRSREYLHSTCIRTVLTCSGHRNPSHDSSTKLSRAFK